MALLSTISAPSATDVAFNAPNFSIKIEGAEIPIGIRQLVQRLEYESAEGMADALKVTVLDPDFVPPKGVGGESIGRLSETKIFQPGNEVSVAMGYGGQLQHIGRAIIRKTRPSFPANNTPTIEVIAYTKDSAMMDNAPEKSKKVKGKGGRRFKDVKYSEAVRERAADYGFSLDVDETPEEPRSFIQKVGLSDYDFVNGLANLTGFLFWVDGDAEGIWTLHFRDPEKIAAAGSSDSVSIQEKKYTFKYNQGAFSSLLAFEPELAIQGAITKLKAVTKDVVTGKLIEVEFTEENDRAPETKVAISGDTLSAVDQVLEGEHTTASDIKLYLNDFAFEIRANRRFRTEQGLAAWARQWFRRQRENFIMARGATIGVETLKARQIHAMTGIGASLSGDYYFSRVNHIMSDTQGYMCDFNCRKVVPPLP